MFLSEKIRSKKLGKFLKIKEAIFSNQLTIYAQGIFQRRILPEMLRNCSHPVSVSGFPVTKYRIERAFHLGDKKEPEIRNWQKNDAHIAFVGYGTSSGPKI